MGDNRMVSFSLGGMAFEYDDNKNQMDVSKFYHGDYYLEELKTIESK